MTSTQQITELSHPDGSSVCCVSHPGHSPVVLFCGGFNSNMQGQKALAFEQACVDADRAYIRFDYRGHGISSGNFEDFAIGEWVADASLVIDSQTPADSKIVLVGSSMGMWVVCHLINQYTSRIAGCVGIAGAPDFATELLAKRLTEEQKSALQKGETVRLATDYDDEGYRIKQRLIDEGEKHRVLNSNIPAPFPVRLFHGTDDDSVPWQHSTRLVEALQGGDIQLTLIKDGDHRLSNPKQLAMLCEAVLTL